MMAGDETSRLATSLETVPSQHSRPRMMPLRILEVRRFYAAFHRAWPYWLYFANLDTDGLNGMVISCLNSFTALKVDGKDHCSVEYDPLELVRFVAQDFPHMNYLCELARMSETEIFHRTRDVFLYFNLPFDGASPSE